MSDGRGIGRADTRRMIKPFLAAVAAVLVLVPAALAADPGSSLTADIQKLTTDRAAMHATVLADIQKLTADAQSQSKPAVQADIK
jgi:ferric-dicitrate binding protein FerR (iron transport regulator)